MKCLKSTVKKHTFMIYILFGINFSVLLIKLLSAFGIDIIPIEILARDFNVMSTYVVLFSLSLTLFLIILDSTKTNREIQEFNTNVSKMLKTQEGLRIDIEKNTEINQVINAFNIINKKLEETTYIKNFLDGIIENIDYSIIVYTPDNLIRAVNKATCELLGYEKKELIGKHIHNISKFIAYMPWDDSNRQIENTYKTKLGEDIPVSIYCSKIKKDHEKSDKMIAIANNINKEIHDIYQDLENILTTDYGFSKKRKHDPGEKEGVSFPKETKTQATGFFRLIPDQCSTEKAMIEIKTDPTAEKVDVLNKTKSALKSSHCMIANLIDNISGTAYRYKNDRIFSIDYISDRCHTLTGYNPTDLIDNNNVCYKDLIHPEDLKFVFAHLNKTVNKGTHFDITYRIITRTGKRIWVQDRGKCVCLNNQPVAIEGILTDISSQKNLENALDESKENFRTLVDKFNIGVLRTTFCKNSIFLYINSPTAKILGYDSTEELMKIEPHKLFINVKERKKFVRNLLHEGKLQNYKIHLKTHSNQSFEILFNGKICYDSNGYAERIDGIIEPVTEKDSKLNDLLKTEKLQSLGLLAGGVAHDFNNLLTGILCNIVLAKMQIPEDQTEVHEILDEVETATARANKLSQQLLSFSKGGMPMTSPSCIKDLIIGCTKFSTRGSGIRCEYAIPDNLWSVNIDENRISQVINNLIINSIQAMPNKGLIVITCRNIIIDQRDEIDLKPGNYVMTSILDQGQGIPDEIVGKIFEPYFTTKNTGNGLGLATCYLIIKEHNGLITAESGKNIGTRFIIYLPAIPKKLDDLNRRKQIVRKKEIPQNISGNVLIMDDEEIIRKSIGSIIKTLGYSIEFATSGEEAINLYMNAIDSDKPFDAIIMDLTIPGNLGAEETLKKLKKKDPSVKAIVISGYSNNPVMIDFEKYGFCGAINKPFEIEYLFNTLKKTISKQ